MHRSVGDDKHLAGGGGAAAVGDWFVQSRDKEEEHLISFASPMQAPPQTAAPATADTEAVPPTMQAMPPQPGRRFCGPPTGLPLASCLDYNVCGGWNSGSLGTISLVHLIVSAG
jgi:hypothetical protein